MNTTKYIVEKSKELLEGFGSVIKNKREEYDLTLEDVSTSSEGYISKTAIHGIEVQRSYPALDSIVAAAAAIGYSVSLTLTELPKEQQLDQIVIK